MKKLVLAAAALVLTAGGAFAENPYVGMPADYAAQLRADKAPPVTGQSAIIVHSQTGSDQGVDYTAPASIPSQDAYSDGSAYGFGDHRPDSLK